MEATRRKSIKQKWHRSVQHTYVEGASTAQEKETTEESMAKTMQHLEDIAIAMFLCILMLPVAKAAAEMMKANFEAAASEAAAMWKACVGFTTIIMLIRFLATKGTAREQQSCNIFRKVGKDGNPSVDEKRRCTKAGSSRRAEKKRRHRVQGSDSHCAEAVRNRLGYVLYAKWLPEDQTDDEEGRPT